MNARPKVNLGEFTFEQQCIVDKLPPFVREYRFHGERKYRFDFAWPQPEYRIAVEIDGGIFNGGAHSNPMNILRDMQKGNLATMEGWRVLHYTPADVKCGIAIKGIKQLLGSTHGQI